MSERLAVVVDDDEGSRVLARLLLRRDGYEIADFEDGETALQALASMRPDCIVFDFRLHDMDGIRFLARARSIPGLEEVPMISVTGSVMPDQRRAVLAAGAAAVISKPVDTRRFVITLEQAMAIAS